MAHAEVQGKAAYRKTADAGSSTSIAANTGAPKAQGSSPQLLDNYQAFVHDGQEFAALGQ